MRLRNEAKVGLIVTAGIVVLIAVYWFLSGLGLRTSTYSLHAVFPTAQRLDKGAMVRMAGIKIGVVLRTTLTADNQARVDLLIDNGVRVSKDSVARLTTGAFIGEFYIDIKPGKSARQLQNGERIRIETFAQPDEILQQVSGILTQLQKSTTEINKMLGDKDLTTTVKDTVDALRQSAEEASRLAVATRTIVENAAPEVASILSNLDSATTGAIRISSQLEDMVAKEIRPNVKATLEQARQTTQKLDSAIQQAQTLIGSFESSSGKLDTALTSVGETADGAKQMIANLSEASVGVRSLATDQQLHADIRSAVKNAALASQQLKELTETLNKKYGQAQSTPAQRSAVPDAGLTAVSLWNTDKGKYRLDANYTLPWTGNSFFRAGVWDLGENTRLNIQAGRTYGQTSVRAGLYASRIGIGLDRRVGPSVLISGDIFRPNRPEMELRGVWGANKSLGIYGGIYDLFHESDRDVYVGVRYKQ